MSMLDPSLLDRALGALYGLALGDAAGMPMQLRPAAAIRAAYGRVDRLLPAPADHPIAAGLPAGRITDDTEQALLLGRLLVDGGGRLDPGRWAKALVDWEADMRARGSLDLLGPSTRRALAAVLAGAPPDETGRYGDTNGAAMRITPVGIATPPEPLGRLVAAVADACRPTHNTGVAIAGAAATAAAVSAGLDGAGWREAVALAVRAAELGAREGHWVAGADVAARIGWAIELVAGADAETAAARIVSLIGTSLATQESVPAAFAALAVADGDPWRAVLLAASLGGDADTIGAIAGAIGGAATGAQQLPAEPLALVRRVNDLDLAPLARDLLALRAAA